MVHGAKEEWVVAFDLRPSTYQQSNDSHYHGWAMNLMKPLQEGQFIQFGTNN